MRPIHLTVVICTHNRVDLLMKAIYSIYLAVIPKNCQINILVIANACTDDTVNHLAQYKVTNAKESSITFDYELEPIPGKSYALNRAINAIPDGFLCFVDDDQTIDIHYFEAIVNAISKYPNTFIFCGRIFPDWQGDEPNWAHSNGKYKIYPPPIPIFDLGENCLSIPDECNALPGGGHTIVHRNIFDKIGKFTESLGPTGHDLMGSEDTDFFQRAVNSGELIQYIPNIEQFHYVDKNRLKLNYLVTKSFQRNRSITLTRNSIGFRIPLYLIRQLIFNFINLTFSSSFLRFRFYLMRCSSTLGEIVGYVQLAFKD